MDSVLKIFVAMLLLIGFTAFVEARPRVLDKKFWIAAGSMVAVTVADVESSQRCFHRGCIETNPYFGASRPGRVRMYSRNLPLVGSYLLGIGVLKRYGPKNLWLVPVAYYDGWELQLTKRNLQWKKKQQEGLNVQ